MMLEAKTKLHESYRTFISGKDLEKKKKVSFKSVQLVFCVKPHPCDIVFIKVLLAIIGRNLT